MNKYFRLNLVLSMLIFTGCSTLNESVKLGSTMGAATGAAATYVAYKDTGVNPDSEKVLAGVGIGLVLGLITSYFTHKEVEENRYMFNGSPETHFGDLPPNPFLIPMNN